MKTIAVCRMLVFSEACQMGNAIMDRSIYSDPIFARLYYETGDMEPEEYFIYQSLFGTLVESLDPPELVVYLDVSADEAVRRIQNRGREDEQLFYRYQQYTIHY